MSDLREQNLPQAGVSPCCKVVHRPSLDHLVGALASMDGGRVDGEGQDGMLAICSALWPCMGLSTTLR